MVLTKSQEESLQEKIELARDGVWEEMVRQAWRDYVNTVNREA